MQEDGTIKITKADLLANSSDPEGDPLSILNLQVAEGQGSLTENTDGSWTFTPDANWNGDVQFSYTVSDNSVPAYQDSLYLPVNGPSWSDAESNAIKLGGHLVSINNEEENNWLINSFGDTVIYH